MGYLPGRMHSQVRYPPTADEPVTFQPPGPVSPDSLASVQGRHGQTFDRTSHEQWSLEQDGKVLKISDTSPGFRGGNAVTITTV